jgi:hypothetical protein
LFYEKAKWCDGFVETPFLRIWMKAGIKEDNNRIPITNAGIPVSRLRMGNVSTQNKKQLKYYLTINESFKYE